MSLRGWVVGSGLVVAAALGIVETSCSSTTTNAVVRTFERAQRLDVVCMRVLDDLDNTIPPQPAVQAQCAPLVSGQNPATAPFHLFALVTQSLRGELAVVDLTAGSVVDVSSTTPGINFLPVGQLPTDVAATPDGKTVFVAAAELEKPAIYALPSSTILGDYFHVSDSAYSDAGVARPPQIALTTWPVCQLPQAPGNISIVAKSKDDGGVATAYQLIVVLPGNATQTAKVVTMDVDPFADPSRFPPGGGSASKLPACVITSAIELKDTLPPTWSPGPSWDNGVPYAPNIDLSAVIDVTTIVPPDDPKQSRRRVGDLGTTVHVQHHLLPPELGCDASTDAAPADGGDVGDSGDAGDGGVSEPRWPLRRTPGTRPHASSLATAGSYLYIADDALPVIHVIDASNPLALREIDPLLTTSARDPSRVVTTKSIAISPATSVLSEFGSYKRFLYAIDRAEGSIMVFEVSDPIKSPHVPLQKPNAELNPFQPPDRILFGVPIAAVSFVRHDVQLTQSGNSATDTGILCNPNKDLDPNDPAAKYRPGGGAAIDIGPPRLRGVFAFATLTNGQVVTIDVDDWDAPCRRPTYMDRQLTHTAPADGHAWGRGALAINQQPTDTGPYASPIALLNNSVTSTDEYFFPAVVPHRLRSLYFFRDDTSGTHIPKVLSTPILYENGAQAPLNSKNAQLTKPFKWFADEKDLGVSLSFDDPTAHSDQDWTVTYEGALAGFDGIAGTLASTDNFATLNLGVGQGVCHRGVEDARVGHERVVAMTAEDPTSLPLEADRRLGDYVQIIDGVLPATDLYWQQANSCWAGDLATDVSQRANLCATTFGGAGVTDASPNRDFPILEAYDDHLVLGQYAYKDEKAPAVGGHIRATTTNPEVMRRAQCCFHNQAHFKVRTGGEWIANSTTSGQLSHLVADPTTRACVPSCTQREVLLSSRAVETRFDRSLPINATIEDARNTSFVLRNPFFATAMVAPELPSASDPTYSFSTRDAQWRFSVRGGFVPQTINLTASTNAVVPQSMRFIESLGQLAIVDGASQGLILIDLNTIGLAHAPYY